MMSGKDRYIRFWEIVVGVGSWKPKSEDNEIGSDVAPTPNIPLSELTPIGAAAMETVLQVNLTNAEES